MSVILISDVIDVKLENSEGGVVILPIIGHVL